MLGRSVDRVQAERNAAGVAHVVARPSRHDNRKISAHLVFDTVNVDRAFALLEAKELVAVGVNLHADLLGGLERHQNELEISASVENPSEILVLNGSSLDVIAISFHPLILLKLHRVGARCFQLPALADRAQPSLSGPLWTTAPDSSTVNCSRCPMLWLKSRTETYLQLAFMNAAS